MSVDSTDFISIAKKNVGAGCLEMEWRVAASRSYYGAYHAAILRSGEVGAAAPLNSYAGGSHSRVIQFYGADNHSDVFCRKRKVISYMLAQAREIRCNADYDIDVSFPEANAVGQIITCEKIIDKLSELVMEVAA